MSDGPPTLASSSLPSPEPPAELQAAFADPARRLGRYVLIAELGRGGMGVVHRAWDLSLGREVAIKMLGEGVLADGQARARFEREARVVAGLQHPGIAGIYEVGQHGGRPFLAMELVPGEDLAAAFSRARFAPRRLAKIVRDLALALEHAHGAGLVHRDVKPQNVMLEADDRVRLMDFGLVREASRAGELTRTGQVIGTLQYMAPEQAAGEIADQGPPTDVYGIGAVLYRGLVGRPPFDAGSGEAGLLKQVIFDDPKPPREVEPLIHIDLETIVLRCLAKEPERRYQTAAAVAAELDRFLEGAPIEARPIGRRERMGRWARRHKALAASSAIAVVATVTLIVGGTVGFVVSFQKIREALDRAELARDQAKAASADAEREASRAKREEADAERARARADAERARAEAADAAKGRLLGRALAERAEILARDGRWEEAAAAAARGLALHESRVGRTVLAEAFYEMRPPVWSAAGQRADHIAWSPAGDRLALAERSGVVSIWDLPTMREVIRLRGHVGVVTALAWHATGDLLASGGADGSVRLWGAAEGTERARHQRHRAPVDALAWSPDGSELASGDRDGAILRWSPTDGATSPAASLDAPVEALEWKAADAAPRATESRPATSPPEPLAERFPSPRSIAWSSDGRLVGVTGDDGALEIADADGATVATLSTGHRLTERARAQWSESYGAADASWSPNGRQLATVGEDALVRIWSSDDGRPLGAWPTDGVALETVVFSPDGERLATGADDGMVRILDAENGEMLQTLQAGTMLIYTIAWSADGTRLASAGSDGFVRLWDIEGGELIATSKPQSTIYGLGFHRDGKRLAWGGQHGVRIADASTLEVQHTIYPDAGVWGLAWLPGKDAGLLAACSDKTLRRIELGETLRAVEVRDHLWSNRRLISTSARSSRIGVSGAGIEGRLLLFDLELNPVDELPLRWARLKSAQLSPGGDRVALTTSGGDVAVAPTGPTHDTRTLRRLPVRFERIETLAWQPSKDRTPQIIAGGRLRPGSFSSVVGFDPNVAGSKIPSAIHIAAARTRQVAWDPTGRRLAIAQYPVDGRADVRVLDTETTRFVERTFETAKKNLAPRLVLAWSPEGDRLAVSVQGERVEDDRIEVLSAVTLETEARFPKIGEVFALAWSPDGRRLVTGSAFQRHVIDLATNEATMTTGGDGAKAIAWREDGLLLHARDAITLTTLRQTDDGHPVEQRVGLLVGHTGVVEALALSPDETRVASTGRDGTVRIWDIDRRRELITLVHGTQDGQRRTALAWSPDGKRLASATREDRTVVIWDIERLLDEKPETLTEIVWDRTGWRVQGLDPVRVIGRLVPPD